MLLWQPSFQLQEVQEQVAVIRIPSGLGLLVDIVVVVSRRLDAPFRRHAARSSQTGFAP